MQKYLTVSKVLNFVTCVGAAIVVFGALQKILHKEFADTFLTIGLITESCIFLIYAFFPPKEEEKFPKVIESDVIMYKKALGEMNENKVQGLNEGVLNEINQNLTLFNTNLIQFNEFCNKFKNILK